MLQSVASKMHVTVDQFPKCHSEIAGEGIEYIWALAKNHYQSILLDKKRGKENFIISCVRECLSETLISRARVQKFSKPAR